MKYWIIILIAAMAVGCSTNKQIDLVSFSKVIPQEISNTGMTLNVEAEINNEFNKRINIEQANFNIFHSQRKIASVQLNGNLTLEPKSSQTYTIPLRLRISRNIWSELEAILQNPSGLRIEGTITGRVGILRKKVKFNRELTEKNINEIVDQIRKKIGI